VLSFLAKAGCQGMAICANGKTRMMAAELSGGATPWLGLHYSEDPLPRGPAGCLRDLKEWGGAETMLAIQGTGWYDFDVAAMVKDHRQHGAAITVGAKACGNGSGLMEPAGVYLVESSALDLIPAVGYHDIKEQFILKAIGAGMHVQCHQLVGSATLIHSPEHYLAAMSEAIARGAADLPAAFVGRSGGGAVHQSALVHPSARLSGAVWIDENAVVEEGAVLIGPVVVGAGARIGAGAIVRRTVVMREARICAGAEVFSDVLGPQAVRSASGAAGLGGRRADAGERGWRLWGRRAGARLAHAQP
jgi:mannose-1-phosphate guanylyltransferase